MSKEKIKYWIDVGLIISFIGVFVTGIFKFYPLRNTFMKVFEIIPKELMRTIHDWSGVTMGLLVLVHLILNWKWLTYETINLFKKEEKNGK